MRPDLPLPAPAAAASPAQIRRSSASREAADLPLAIFGCRRQGSEGWDDSRFQKARRGSRRRNALQAIVVERGSSGNVECGAQRLA